MFVSTTLPLLASDFSSRIKAQRLAAQLSQSQLAAIAGVSTSFVRDAESVAGRCTLDKLLAVLNALNIELAFSDPVGGEA
jgi:transcriptional regulator with XRE-family HTH domain